MNRNIQQLYEIAQKKTRTIIGLMSGTSVDGLDIAVCSITGSGISTKVTLSHFETFPYEAQFKEYVASIFSKKMVELEAVCLLNEWIGIAHGKMILEFLKKRNIPISEIDLIASHGQTIYHAPKSLHKNHTFGNGTLQIGDGDHIAVTTGIITLSDFRQKHIAAGGEGAPLAVYGDYLIFGQKDENRILLNIGGIANFTYLPATMLMNEVFSTDVGPGNTLLDAYCKKYFSCDYDKDSKIALTGTLNEALLKELLHHPFFDASFPKTTGPELFNLAYLENAQQASFTTNLSPQDVLCTLTHFSAQAIIQSIGQTTTSQQNLVIYSSGGGMHNPLLMSTIQRALPHIQFKTTSHLQIHPDAKEAVLFAVLANETVAGNVSFNSGKTDIPAISMGKICFPF